MSELISAFDLNESHKESLSKFISFIKIKEQKVLKEIGFFFEDFYDMNVQDTVYNQKDIKSMIWQMKEHFNKNVQGELNYFTNLSALFVQFLLHDAESKKQTLQIELSQIENMNNMKQMDDLVNMITSPVNIKDTSGKGKLSSISSTAKLIEDLDYLTDKYKLLETEHENLNNKCNMLMKENQNLINQTKNNSDTEIKSLMNKINLESNNSSNSNSKLSDINKSLENELTNMKKNLADQMQKYQDLTSEFEKKLSESTQFKQLKKFLNEKNALVADLRKKLSVYEGES